MSADPLPRTPTEELRFDVRVRLGDFELRAAHRLPAEGVTAVFGPSGSGKSTLLRVLAGLEPEATGRVSLGDRIWLETDRGTRVPAHRRPVGTMFQEARLFPHLDVRGNLDYADRRSDPSRGDRSRAPLEKREVVDALDLGPLLDRRVAGLSGGERQRAALGRTLLTRPRLLLLDEPLAGLDAERKREILPYVESLQARFGLPTLYVSHSIEEVALLAGRILVLADGRVRAEGPTADLLEELELGALAAPGETASVVEALVLHYDPDTHLTWLDLSGRTMSVPGLAHLAKGELARLLVRARDVSLARERPRGLSIRNLLEARITALDENPASAFCRVSLDVGGQHLQARITRASRRDLELVVGDDVVAMVKSVSLESGARAPR